MSLADTTVKMLAIADSLSDAFQVTIKHSPWIGDSSTDGFSDPEYGPAIAQKAIYEELNRKVTLTNDEVVEAKGRLTFPRPLIPNGALGRIEPIDERDKFILPDKSTGKILEIRGIPNPNTGRPYMTEVLLGVGT